VRRALAAWGRAAALGLVAAAAPAQDAPPTAPPDRRVDLDVLRYYTGEQLQAALESIAGAYPELVRLESMGRSRGGRELWVVTLAAREGSDPAGRGALLVVGGLGASDPHGVEMALFTLYDLVLNHARDPSVAELLRAATVYLVPCLDPDGRARLLEPPTDGAPPPRGVALDRNFPAGWSPWLQGAGGAYPLCEPESRALAEFELAHPNVAIVQTYAESAATLSDAGGTAGGLALATADAALHAAVSARAAQQLEQPALLVSAAQAPPPGGSLLAHAVGDRGALGFVSLVGGRGEPRLPQVQELFGLARRAAGHTMLLGRCLPRLEIAAPVVTRLRNELWQVDVQVSNAGLLATAGPTARARRLVAPPRFELGGGQLVAAAVGSAGEEGLRPLAQPGAAFELPEVPGGGRVQLRLVVAAPADSELSLSLVAPRSGRASGTVLLR
jgi:hypothetical protein